MYKVLFVELKLILFPFLEPEPGLADQLRRRVELLAHEKPRAGGEDIVPHQRLVVVQVEAFEEPHGHEDARGA